MLVGVVVVVVGVFVCVVWFFMFVGGNIVLL